MAVKPLRLGLLIEPEIIPTPQATTWRYSNAPDLANQAVIPCDVMPWHYIKQPMGVTQGLEVTRMSCYRAARGLELLRRHQGTLGGAAEWGMLDPDAFASPTSCLRFHHGTLLEYQHTTHKTHTTS